MNVKSPDGQPPLAQAYETFVRDLSDLGDGQPTVLVLRDLTAGRRKYFAQNALAVVRLEADPAGKSRPLRVRSRVGNLLPGQWQVTILEILPSRIPGKPYASLFDALERAWGRGAEALEPPASNEPA